MSLGDQFDSVLRSAQTGAGWALGELYRDLHPRVRGYLYAREPREAEDLACDVWLDVARALDRFTGDEAALRGWVFTIAKRRLVDFRRQQASRRTTPEPLDGLVPHGGVGDVEDEALVALGTDAALARIAALPPDQAEVVLLRVLGDLSVQQVATIIDKSPGAVRALQLRALRRLARTTSREAVTE